MITLTLDDTQIDLIARRAAEMAPAQVRSRLLDVDAAATYLGVTPNAVRAYVRKEMLRPVRMNGRVLFDIRDLDRRIEAAKL